MTGVTLFSASDPASFINDAIVAVDRGLVGRPCNRAFAKLCGVSPIEAPSGKTVRHRLNRGGNRDANRAMHVICVVRLRRHQPTRDYLARRIGEGRTIAEIMRCIKRYIAREIYHAVRPTRQEIPTQTIATTQ